jgi:hypothetical protein
MDTPHVGTSKGKRKRQPAMPEPTRPGVFLDRDRQHSEERVATMLSESRLEGRTEFRIRIAP